MVPYQELDFNRWPLVQKNKILSTALTVAMTAGKVLHEGFYSNSEASRLQYRSDAEKVASEIVAKQFRQAVVMASGVTSDVDLSGGDFWLINVNGKENYKRGMYLCDLSVAQVKRGSLRLGIVHDFIHGEIYYAIAGKGAYNNGDRIHVSDRPFDQSVITFAPLVYREAKGRHDNEEVDALWDGMRKISFNSGRFHRELQSGGLELAWVACGRLDGYASSWTDPWNLVAGALLVVEAGGRATDIFNRPYKSGYDGLIAGNEKVHAAMMDIFSPLIRQ